ncbi:MAG: hypothetical protein M1835_000106 [Candelina submexicana]|nr:MAG: hypothetical protein M1835_000106 [Candelina submexicana]
MVLATGLLATPLAGSNQTIVTAYMEKARVDPQFGRVDEAVIVFEVAPLVAPYLEESFDWDPVNPFNRTAIQQYRGILDSGLSSVQAAITPWLALTANGTFAIDHVNPAANARDLFKPFYVWILSLWSQGRIEGDGIMATVSRNTDARAFHKYGHDSRFPTSCDYYEANNICSAWWHHDATNATYSITNLFKRKSSKDYYQAMKDIFGSNLFGGEDFFLNRDVCGDFSQQFMVRDSKTINCLIYSRLQFAEFSPTCEDPGCEFGGDPDSQVDWVDDHCFPASYLGDLRSKEGTKYVPCSFRDS